MKPAEEWLRQANYDIETAEAMWESGRYFYVVFMCHLSLEKALKGLFYERQSVIPPKIHNLIYFIEKLKLEPPIKVGDFISLLNSVSVPTRYPDNLERIKNEFQSDIVQKILADSKEALEWIKKQFSKP